MRRIINGKLYDTETATPLASASSPEGRSDYRYWAEDLYRSKRGAYFLHGRGGALSSWAESAGGNTRTGGEGIRVLTDEQARAWVERYANSSYEAIFGPPEEG